MQAFCLIQKQGDYTAWMKPGRPTQQLRTPFGERLYTMREQAGLSQQRVAERIGISQRVYAYWERHPVALRPDQLLKLSGALNISLEEMVGNTVRKREGGPAGKMRQLFETASKLPRSQQQKIAAVVEAFVSHHANNHG